MYIYITIAMTLLKKTVKMKNSTIESNFRTLVNGNTGTIYNGIVGTNHGDREAIWEAFRNEYPDMVNFEINGMMINLKANHSISGKSTSYHGSLSNAQYIKLNGSDFGLSKKGQAHISVNGGVIELHGGGKYFTKIENSRVTSIF